MSNNWQASLSSFSLSAKSRKNKSNSEINSVLWTPSPFVSVNNSGRDRRPGPRIDIRLREDLCIRSHAFASISILLGGLLDGMHRLFDPVWS